MNNFKKIGLLFSEVTNKEVFDHIKNFFVCAFLLTIGMNEFKQHSSLFFDLVPNQLSGTGVIFLSILLFFLNLNDGIKKISKSKHHLSLTILLVIIYIFLSVRVIEMAWQFRAI